MTERKKQRSGAFETEFEESVARYIQTDPAELADALEKVKAQQEKVRRHVEQTSESIKQGARRSKHRFRL